MKRLIILAAMAATLAGCAPRLNPVDSRDGDIVTVYKRARENKDNSLPPLPYFQQRAEELCGGKATFLDNALVDNYPIWYVRNRYTCVKAPSQAEAIAKADDLLGDLSSGRNAPKSGGN